VYIINYIKLHGHARTGKYKDGRTKPARGTRGSRNNLRNELKEEKQKHGQGKKEGGHNKGKSDKRITESKARESKAFRTLNGYDRYYYYF
jgi:hypothetical protein